MATAPERTLTGNASVSETRTGALPSVFITDSTAVAVSNVAGVGNRVINPKAGTTTRNNKPHGIIIIGLRPKRSDNQPPTGARQKSVSPTMTVVANATS